MYNFGQQQTSWAPLAYLLLILLLLLLLLLLLFIIIQFQKWPPP